MIVFPHAKINLGLNVLRKRGDGYHDIESVLYPIPLRDALEVVEAPDVSAGEVVFTSTGIAIPGTAQGNLCVKAVELVRKHRPLPGLRIHLHKVIPTGAGLGGGSSDGARMIQLLDDLLDLQLGDQLMHELATALGSDCPFFLSDRPQLVTGRGDVLAPLDLDLKGWWLVLANPGIHVGTAEVYANTIPSGHTADLSRVLASGAPSTWSGRVVNGMEEYVFRAYPAVRELRDHLVGLGAEYAAMSGSGSSVFGLFSNEPTLPERWWRSALAAWKFRL